MNVRNLKQMYERKSSHKEEQPKEESSIRPKLITQPSIKPSIVFNYEQQQKLPSKTPQKPTEKQIQQPRVSVKNNKFFLDELNKKLQMNNANQPIQKVMISEPEKESFIAENKGANKSSELNLPPFPPKKRSPSPIEEKKIENDEKFQPQKRGFLLPFPQSKQTVKPEEKPIQVVPEEKPILETKSDIIPRVQAIKKSDSQIMFDDVLAGAGRISNNTTINMRYGINEKYPTRERQKSLFTHDPNEEESTKNGTFSDMLQNMLDSLKRKKPSKEEQGAHKSETIQQKKITNKIEYDESYKTEAAKRKRIQFVTNVIFRNLEFQNIALAKQNPSQVLSKPFQIEPIIDEKPQQSQPKTEKEKFKRNSYETPQKLLEQNPRNDKEIVLEEIVKKKNEQNEQKTISSTLKRPSQVSNQFMNELTLKLMKKSMDSTQIVQEQKYRSSINQEESKPFENAKQHKIIQKKEESEKIMVDLAPRKKKKPRTKQNFDDF